jgi:thioredoxin
MKKLGFLTLAALLSVTSMSCNSNAAEGSSEVRNTKAEINAAPEETETAKVVVLTEAKFKELVWDYDASPQEWKYKGKLPAVIDFYADWCGPCKRVAPIMEKLAKEYDGKIIIYKVNTDQNRELSGVFGIKSIPSILFIPKEGQPAMQPGAMTEDQYKKIFEEYVLGNKTAK